MGTLGLSLPENISGSHSASGPQVPAAGKAVVDDLSADKSLLPELNDLRKESDEKLLFQSLLSLGGRLKTEQRLESAQALLGRLSQEDVPEEYRNRARSELDALMGKGAIGARAEFLLSRFCKDATNPRLILPMMAGTLAGEMVGTFALGRLAGTAAEGSAWLGRGLTARIAAGSAGYLSEVSAFAAMNHAMGPANASLLEDFERSALTIGALRAFGYSTRKLMEGLTIPATAQGLRFAVGQSGMFLGLVTSHKLEERFGLRPQVEGSTFLLDTFASMLSLGVGAHLGKSALGPGFARFQSELQLRTQDSANSNATTETVAPELALAVAGGPRAASLPGKGLNLPILMSSMAPGGMGGGGPRYDGTQFRPPASEAANEQGSPNTVSQQRVSPQGSQPAPQAPQLPPPQPLGNPTVPDPYLGKLIDGRYQIEAKLGEGGMGYVYRARHSVIGKHVALKVLKPEFSKDIESTARFINEAKAATLIGNPHIIEINDFGKMEDGATYFVMEYLKGKSLGDLMEGEVAVPAFRMVRILRQIAEGLSAAHRVGIVHRDLKPDNVYLVEQGHDPDYVKILDFGIAKMPRGDGQSTKLTQVGQVFGTPAYFSPEQAAGNPVDKRGDIYSLGALAYEMASGKLPFTDLTPLGLMHKHMYHPLTPPRELPSTPKDFPPELEAIILKCMAKKMTERYQSMEEVIKELDRYMAGVAPRAVEDIKSDPEAFNEPDEAYVPPMRRKSLRPAILAATAATAVTSLAGVAFWTLTGKKESHAGTDASTSPSAPPPPATAPTPSNTPNKIQVERRNVQVTVDPIDAHIFVDGLDLGNNSVQIPVESGKPVTVEIRKPGFETKTLVLDGSHPEEKVQLNRDSKKKIPPKNGSSGVPSAPKPKSSRPGDDVVVPWK